MFICNCLRLLSSATLSDNSSEKRLRFDCTQSAAVVEWLSSKCQTKGCGSRHSVSSSEEQ